MSTTMSLREWAIKAHRFQVADEKRRMAELAKATAQQELADFGHVLSNILQEEIAPESLEVTIDGLTLAWTPVDRHGRRPTRGVYLAMGCAERYCDGRTWHRVRRVEDIGRVLDTGSKDYCDQHYNARGGWIRGAVIPCPACNGQGVVTVDERYRWCAHCHGRTRVWMAQDEAVPA